MLVAGQKAADGFQNEGLQQVLDRGRHVLSLHAPGGLAFDNEGNLYLADTLNQRIRRIDVNGQIETVAGTGASGYLGDGRPATNADLNLATNPLEGIGQGLAVDSRGDVFIAAPRGEDRNTSVRPRNRAPLRRET